MSGFRFRTPSDHAKRLNSSASMDVCAELRISNTRAFESHIYCSGKVMETLTPLSVEAIDEGQADRVAQIEEGQFSDLKARAIAPAKLSNTISAFANSDGGDLYIGLSEEHLGGGAKVRKWD